MTDRLTMIADLLDGFHVEHDTRIADLEEVIEMEQEILTDYEFEIEQEKRLHEIRITANRALLESLTDQQLQEIESVECDGEVTKYVRKDTTVVAQV